MRLSRSGSWISGSSPPPSSSSQLLLAISSSIVYYSYFDTVYNFIIITFIPFKLGKRSSSSSSIKKNYGSVKTIYIRNQFHSPSLSIGSSPQRYSATNSDKAWLSLLPNRARPSRTKLFKARATSLSFDIAKRKSRTARTKQKGVIKRLPRPQVQVSFPARVLSN